MRARWLLPLALVAGLGCSSGSDSPSAPSESPDVPNPGPGTPRSSATVSVQDDFFSPSSVTVQRASGTAKVTWQWYGSDTHSVVFDAGGPNAPAQSTGVFERDFTSAGSFTYYCSVHGRNVMSGTVIVQ